MIAIHLYVNDALILQIARPELVVILARGEQCHSASTLRLSARLNEFVTGAKLVARIVKNVFLPALDPFYMIYKENLIVYIEIVLIIL